MDLCDCALHFTEYKRLQKTQVQKVTEEEVYRRLGGNDLLDTKGTVPERCHRLAGLH